MKDTRDVMSGEPQRRRPAWKRVRREGGDRRGQEPGHTLPEPSVAGPGLSATHPVCFTSIATIALRVTMRRGARLRLARFWL